MTACMCCAASAGEGRLFCDTCQAAWDASPERQQANDAGVFGAERAEIIHAWAMRRRTVSVYYCRCGAVIGRHDGGKCPTCAASGRAA